MEPTEPEILKGAIVSWLADVHTSLPGKVMSYDPAKQAADVQPAVQRAVQRSDGGHEFKDYPIIPNVQVAWLAAGGCSFQMPMQQGDAVWLCFSEACWAQYRRTGQITQPGDLRRFDLSYPIAIPYSLTQALRNVTSGPHLEVPTGKVFTVGGDPSALKAVAIAEKVDAELDKLKQALMTATYVNASGVATVLAVAPPIALLPTAATKLKTE